MGNFAGSIGMTGDVKIKVLKREVKAPLSWRLRNALRLPFIKSWIGVFIVQPIANKFGLLTAWGQLSVKVIKANGQIIDYGVVSRQVVTDAGVAYLVDDWDGGANVIDNFNYHGVGTGTTAENATQTALVTESTTALNPDGTRATGTKSQPSANIMQTVGTLTFDAAAAITEHGVFTQAATGGGTLLDRSMFSAVNVGSGDSIQCTYALTWSSGG